jgi:ligand-binding sensor domain-containing protein
VHNNLSRYFLIIVAVLLFVISNGLFAQKGSQEKYLISQVRIEDGLSQSTVFAIIQDKKGFLWFGTANGLNRYDGYSFTVFTNDPADTTSISDNGILSLFEDKDGNIWIGTIEGVLNKYDRKTGIFAHYNMAEPFKINILPKEPYYEFPLPFSRTNDNSITSITQDAKGFLWIGTWGKGLIKFDVVKNKIEYLHYGTENPEGLSTNRIRAIIPNSDGTIWIGTFGGGLYKMITNGDKPQLIKYVHSKSAFSLSDDKIVSLFKDREGNLWIGTYENGLNKFSKKYHNRMPHEAVFEKFIHKSGDNTSISSGSVVSIIQDSYRNIWIGLFAGGLNLFNQSQKTFAAFKSDPQNPNSLSSENLLSIFEDKSGCIWIGTHLGKGLNKLERNKVKFKQLNRNTNGSNGLNDDVVWAIKVEDNSIVWVGTYMGGLNKYDRKTGKSFYFTHDPRNPNSISDNHIRAIVDDNNGNLWIGTYNGGLNKFNKATSQFTRFNKFNNDSVGLGAKQVQAILIDKEKNLWVGTYGGGLNKFIGTNVSQSELPLLHFIHNDNDPFSISNSRVYCLTEDHDGIIWVGTFGGGLNKFDKITGKFIAYKNIPGDETSLTDDRVMSIYEDVTGNLWVGTYGGGLQKFDKRTEKFVRYDKKDKMNSSVVYGILEDKKRNLWMSTDNGLYKFNLQTEHFTQYDLHDGLQSLEFSGGAYCKSKTGEMFFGGINGLNYFYPDSVKDNAYIPPIVISTVKIFNQPVRGERDTLELSYSQNFFSFEFATLDYTNPADNRYAYMLEGFDAGWRYADSRNRIANYTNLSPGEYIFHVHGSNNDGVWNNEGAKIYLKILPPLWKRWWFVTTIILLVAFLIFYLSTMRYRNLLAIEKLKGKLAADLHDNVGSGLTEISILSELALQEVKNLSPNSSKQLNVVSEKARQLIDNMSDIVWVVNPQRDSLYHLVLRLKDTYSDLLYSTGISFGTSNLEKISNTKLSMEYKQNLFLLFKEGINNSIKHSKCKRISLDVSYNKDILELELKDDGVGIDLQNIKNGNGIINMKNRAKNIGGKIIIDSSKEGTSLKFVGKVGGIKKYFLSFKNT